ncbi:hypothetical protein BHE74_00056517 [Ensete ventricosum]|nr:hypothetical protein BHE74_00056517 [Ensete ventricosum]
MIESKTNLNSSRFWFLLIDQLEVNARDVYVGMNDLCAVVGGELEQDARNAEVDGEVVGPINKEVGEEGEGQAREHD